MVHTKPQKKLAVLTAALLLTLVISGFCMPSRAEESLPMTHADTTTTGASTDTPQKDDKDSLNNGPQVQPRETIQPREVIQPDAPLKPRE